MADQMCPESGETMTRDVRPMLITYKGLQLAVDMPGWYCPTCGESVHSGEDMKVSDRALNRLKAEVEGVLLPEEIRRIRKKLKLTQRDAGRYIGGGPNAFQKYESGDILASKGITSALLLLNEHPSGIEILRHHAREGQAA